MNHTTYDAYHVWHPRVPMRAAETVLGHRMVFLRPFLVLNPHMAYKHLEKGPNDAATWSTGDTMKKMEAATRWVEKTLTQTRTGMEWQPGPRKKKRQ